MRRCLPQATLQDALRAEATNHVYFEIQSALHEESNPLRRIAAEVAIERIFVAMNIKRKKGEHKLRHLRSIMHSCAYDIARGKHVAQVFFTSAHELMAMAKHDKHA